MSELIIQKESLENIAGCLKEYMPSQPALVPYVIETKEKSNLNEITITSGTLQPGSFKIAFRVERDYVGTYGRERDHVYSHFRYVDYAPQARKIYVYETYDEDHDGQTERSPYDDQFSYIGKFSFEGKIYDEWQKWEAHDDGYEEYPITILTEPLVVDPANKIPFTQFTDCIHYVTDVRYNYGYAYGVEDGFRDGYDYGVEVGYQDGYHTGKAQMKYYAPYFLQTNATPITQNPYDDSKGYYTRDQLSPPSDPEFQGWGIESSININKEDETPEGLYLGFQNLNPYFDIIVYLEIKLNTATDIPIWYETATIRRGTTETKRFPDRQLSSTGVWTYRIVGYRLVY